MGEKKKKKKDDASADTRALFAPRRNVVRGLKTVTDSHRRVQTFVSPVHGPSSNFEGSRKRCLLLLSGCSRGTVSHRVTGSLVVLPAVESIRRWKFLGRVFQRRGHHVSTPVESFARRKEGCGSRTRWARDAKRKPRGASPVTRRTNDEIHWRNSFPSFLVGFDPSVRAGLRAYRSNALYPSVCLSRDRT